MFRPARAASTIAGLLLGAGLAAAEAAPAAIERGPDYRVVQWTTADGLPQNTVTDVVVLPSGELWLSTFGGLARFDGHGFRVLDMAADEGLPANRIVSLVATGEDSFLFLTQQGHLGRVENGRSETLLPPPLASVETLELLVDRVGRVYCRATDGRVWRTEGGGAWRPVVGTPGGSGALHALALDESGDAWTVWGDRLLRLDGGPPGESFTLPGREVAVAARAGGGLWIGVRRGVARFVDGRLSLLPIRPALEEKVHVIAPISESALWVATSGGVSRLDREADGSWRRSSVSLRLPENVTVRSLGLDREGGLWVGTNGGGLRRVHSLPTRRYGAESGLADVAALARDGAGGAFVASGCRTLLHLDGSGAARPVPLPRAVGAGTLLPCGISLAPGPGDSVWGRSGSRLFRLRRHRLEAELVSRDVPFEEGPIVAHPDGSVWVASRGGDVRLVSPQGRTVRELRVPAPVMSAALGPDGALWLGGDGAVFRVVGDAVDRVGSGEHGPRGLVRDVVPEPDGTAWIGTYGGGLGRLQAGRVVRLSVEQGLPDNSISRILDDGRGRLWISTNRGLAVVRKSDLEAVADGRARALEPVVFGTERGVAEANFGSPAGFADEGGRLWFGTIAGAVSVDAAAFPFNPTPPAVRIEEIRADGQLHPLGPAVSLPPLTARLRLGFNAFAPLYPERMRYRFRVEGMDADWVEAGAGHTVDWSPPGPGRHRFLVEARNEDGIWSSAPAVVVLDVRPAWFQTTVVRATAALVLALAVAAGVRRRIRGIERRHADRLRVLEEQRQAEEKVASLRAQLEHVSRAALAGELATSLAHEVRQPIGAIVNNAEAVRRQLPQYLQRPAELEQVFADIVADAVRASEVVEGLRGFLKSGGPGPRRSTSRRSSARCSRSSVASSRTPAWRSSSTSRRGSRPSTACASSWARSS